MTDREMLELAAKAGGLKIDPSSWGEYQEAHGGMLIADGRHWNSAIDYGDAFELAVRLKIRMEPTENYAVAYAGSVCAEQFTEQNGNSPVLAMCRAVTRAAAEIGRNMP